MVGLYRYNSGIVLMVDLNGSGFVQRSKLKLERKRRAHPLAKQLHLDV